MNPDFAMHPSGRRQAAATSSPFEPRRMRSRDIDEHTGHLHDWNLYYDQLDAGRFDGEFIDLRLPRMQVFMESTSRRVRQNGSLIADSVGVGTMLRGEGAMGMNGIRCKASTLLVCNSSELDLCTPPDCVLAGAVLETGLLGEAAEALGVMEKHFKLSAVLAMTPPAEVLARWQHLLRAAVQAAMPAEASLDHAAARQRLQDDLLLTLIELMTGAARDERVQYPDHRKRMVDRACELMLSRLDEPFSLLEVCQRVGASPRKLNYCFQDNFGISTGRFIKTLRLNAVRRELNKPNRPTASVYDAAARWGFWHFGHFSSDYKKLFGEPPSQTLGRARSFSGG